MYKRWASLKTSPFECAINLHHVEVAEHTFISEACISHNTLTVHKR